MRTGPRLIAVALLAVSTGCLNILIPGHESAVEEGEADMAMEPGPGNDPGQPDVDGGLGGDGGTTQSGCIDPTTPRVAAQDHEHGNSCLTCHDGVNNVLWTVAGTVFQSAGSIIGVGGATVEVIDANNKVVRMVTTAGGNFFTDEALVFPLRVRATSCPADRAMPTQVTQGMGSCNAAGCHGTGQRIHLP
jgi:hypothetical protein